jgi:hypothetical protein
VFRIRITDAVGSVFHFDADSDPTFDLDADPDPTFHFDVDPDPKFHFFADPDPDPAPHENDANLPTGPPPLHFDRPWSSVALFLAF